MLELLLAVVIIALVAWGVSIMLGQPAGVVAFIVLLIIVLLSAPGVNLH